MMKKTTQIIIVFGFILLLLGILAGCGKSEKRFVGKWINESNGYVETLDLKPDGTYRLVKPAPFGSGSVVTTGTWEVVKEEGEEGISFTPPLGFYIGSLKKKGNMLVHPISGKSYVKQD